MYKPNAKPTGKCSIASERNYDQIKYHSAQ